MDLIDSRTIHPDGFPPAVSIKVEVFTDPDYTPHEYASERDNPLLFAAWRRGEMSYVTVVATPTVDAIPLAQAAENLSGVEFGQCDWWEQPVGMDYLCDVSPVPDMIPEIAHHLCNVYNRLTSGGGVR